MDNKSIIGSRLNAALARRNVKQKELAQYLNVPDNTISYFCSGKRTPNVRQIIEIAKRLEISTDYLLGFDVPPTTKQATKELCATLGLTDISIECLSSPDSEPIKRAINFLFDQHYRSTTEKKEKQQLTTYERLFANQIEDQISILDLLAEFIALQNAACDVRMLLTPNGHLSVCVEESEKCCDLLNTQVSDFIGGFADISLLNAAAKDHVNTISQILISIADKRAAQIQLEKYCKEEANAK